MTPLDLFLKLDMKRQACNPGFLDDYYDGLQKVRQLGLSLPPDMRSLETVVNWPRLVVDSIAERMDVEAFRVAGNPGLGEKAMDWWLANDLDAGQKLTHVEALVQGAVYVVVNVGESEDFPRFTMETTRSMAVKVNGRTNTVEAASYVGDWDDAGQPMFGALYLADRNYYFTYGSNGWMQSKPMVHNLGQVPVFPMLNKSRLGDRSGRSEITDIIPMTDAAARLMTNLQAAQEFLALPQRYVFGAAKEDFVDEEGNPVTGWQARIGSIFALVNEKASAGNFPGADLRNFVDVYQMYARVVASLSKLPPHRLGLASNNAVSADAIRSEESDLIKRIYDRMRTFESTWESAMRLAFKWMGVTVPEIQRLEVIWASPETPTFAAKADAVSKLVGSNIIPVSAARRELFSPEKAKEYDDLADADALKNPMGIDTSLLFQEPANGVA